MFGEGGYRRARHKVVDIAKGHDHWLEWKDHSRVNSSLRQLHAGQAVAGGGLSVDAHLAGAGSLPCLRFHILA